MIDSGASSNFLSRSVVERLGLVVKREQQQQVSLANNQKLRTVGHLETMVVLGPLQSYLRFEVLDADIPCILGMTFLHQVNPVIDWQRAQMRVKHGSRTTLIQCSVFKRNNALKVEKRSSDVASGGDDVATSSQHHVGMEVEKVHANEFSGLPLDDNLVVENCACSNEEEVVDSVDENSNIYATKYAKLDLKNASESCSSRASIGVESVDKKFLVATQQAEMCGGFTRCMDIAMKSKKRLVSGMCPNCSQPYLDENAKGLDRCTQCGSCVERVPGKMYNPLASFFQQKGQ